MYVSILHPPTLITTCTEMYWLMWDNVLIMWSVTLTCHHIRSSHGHTVCKLADCWAVALSGLQNCKWYSLLICDVSAALGDICKSLWIRQFLLTNVKGWPWVANCHQQCKSVLYSRLHGVLFSNFSVHMIRIHCLVKSHGWAMLPVTTLLSHAWQIVRGVLNVSLIVHAMKWCPSPAVSLWIVEVVN